MSITLTYTCFLIIVSFITICLYGIDKFKAKKEKRRISEKCLFAFGIFGGALGSLIGMIFFHHKTKHVYFWVINFLMLIIQIIIFFLLIYLETKYL